MKFSCYVDSDILLLLCWQMINCSEKSIRTGRNFLTKGTVEERIDMMLEEKSRLSQDVIASTGDAWITEMKDDDLVDLFRLTL